MCFMWISEQTAIISLYNINWLVFITDGECLLSGTDWVCIYNVRTLCSTVHVSTCCNELWFVCEFLKAYELHQSEVAFKMFCSALLPLSAVACYVTVIMLLALLTFWVQEQLHSCGALQLRCELSAYFERCQFILWDVSLFWEVSVYFMSCQLILLGVSLFWEVSVNFMRCQLILRGVSLFCEVSAYFASWELILWVVSLFWEVPAYFVRFELIL